MTTQTNQLNIPSLARPEVAAHPFEYYRAVRENDPIHYDQDLGFYIVSRYDDALTVLRNPETFSSELGFKAQAAGPYAKEVEAVKRTEGITSDPSIFIEDPPRHTRIRALVEQAFRPDRVAAMEPHIEEVVRDLIEGLPREEVVDLVETFSNLLPVIVIADILGVEKAYRNKFREWSNAVLASVGGYRHLTREQALSSARSECEMQHFLKEQLEERNLRPRDDMMSHLLHAHLGTGVDKFSFVELISVISTLLVAGNDTTTQTASYGLLILSTQPEVMRELRDAPNRNQACVRFAEELVRYQPAALGVPRVAKTNTRIGDVEIPAGAAIYVGLASSNRDEAHFTNANEFDPSRVNLLTHLSFGAGIRRCVGALLARTEIKAATKGLLEHFDHLQLAISKDQVEYEPHILTRRIKTLPIRLTRRSAGEQAR